MHTPEHAGGVSKDTTLSVQALDAAHSLHLLKISASFGRICRSLWFCRRFEPGEEKSGPFS